MSNFVSSLLPPALLQRSMERRIPTEICNRKKISNYNFLPFYTYLVILHFNPDGFPPRVSASVALSQIEFLFSVISDEIRGFIVYSFVYELFMSRFILYQDVLFLAFNCFRLHRPGNDRPVPCAIAT